MASSEPEELLSPFSAWSGQTDQHSPEGSAPHTADSGPADGLNTHRGSEAAAEARQELIPAEEQAAAQPTSFFPPWGLLAAVPEAGNEGSMSAEGSTGHLLQHQMFQQQQPHQPPAMQHSGGGLPPLAPGTLAALPLPADDSAPLHLSGAALDAHLQAAALHILMHQQQQQQQQKCSAPTPSAAHQLSLLWQQAQQQSSPPPPPQQRAHPTPSAASAILSPQYGTPRQREPLELGPVSPGPSPAETTQSAVLRALSSRSSIDAPSAAAFTPRPSFELPPAYGQGTGSGGIPSPASTGSHATGSTPMQEAMALFFPSARYSHSLEAPAGCSPDQYAPPGADGAAGRGLQRLVGGSDSAATALALLEVSAQHHPRVRALVSAGGGFRMATGGGGGGRGVSYHGGDVRLIGLPEGCTLAELVAVLAKTERAAPAAGGSRWSSASGEKAASAASSSRAAGMAYVASRGGLATWPGAAAAAALVRYQLPSDTSVFVDVVDDEDCRLMFEEYAEHRARDGSTARKLHIFVEWRSPRPSPLNGSVESEDLMAAACVLPRSSWSLDSLGAEEEEQGDLGEGGGLRAGHAAHQSASELRVAAVRTDQLEVISSGGVILTELLGTGTFGDMYKGRWRGCDVAVKCLNPASVGLQYSSRTAWLQFLGDANRMGALRHPGLVEVYGVVLPGAMDPRGQQQQAGELASCHLEDFSADDVQLRGARRASWDFGAASYTQQQHIASPQKVQQQYQHLAPGATALGAPAAAATLMSSLRGGSLSGLSAPRAEVAPSRMLRLPGPVTAPPALVMEFLRGRSLRGAIARRDDSVAGLLGRIIYALDAARAMAYLHSKGVTHYDFKSANVLLGHRDRRPMAKVAGYGLTNRKVGVASYSPGVTMSRNVLPWAAPEIIRAPEKVSRKADIYSFAIVMWELWTLQLPYADVAYFQDLVSILVNTDRQVRPAVPGEGSAPAMEEPGPGWSALMQRCWAEEPEARPEFSEIAEELKEIARKVRRSQRGGPARANSQIGGGKVEVEVEVEGEVVGTKT